MIKIDRGIPLPEDVGRGRHNGPSSRRVYPWHDLEVGDSFAVPCKSEARANARSSSMRRMAYGAGGSTGHKYVIRACVERGRHVVRVWRES